MIRPTARCVLLFGLCLPVALLPTWVGEEQWMTWAVFLASCVGLVIVDGALLMRSRGLDVDVQAPNALYIGDAGGLELRLHGTGARRVERVDVRLDCDPLPIDPPDQGVDVPPGGSVALSLALRPERRGTIRLAELWLRWRGPLALLERVRRDVLDRSVPVLPNTPAVRAAAIRFSGTPNARAGLKTERFVGDGSEFESLRKWVPGFDNRSIDWKATARHADLLCRNYRAERNHQVMLVVDSGRLMGEPVAGLPRLDHAINAALLLAWVALRTGDRVGLYNFDERPRNYLAPQARASTLHRFSHAAAAMEYSAKETNYTLGMLELARRLRRRSLVVVFTDYEDDVTARLMVDTVAQLARRHVVLFLAMADPGLEALECAEPAQLADVGRSVVASDMLRNRRAVLARIRTLGVHVIETRPDSVSTDLVNRYLDIKRRELV